MKRALVWLIPLTLGGVLYLPSLGFDLTFDDVHHIAPPGQEEERSLGEVWNRPYWETAEKGGLYRPITSMTFWAEGKLRLPLAARHGFNLALHLLVTALVVRLALGMGLRRGALLAGLVFALHPVHVEAVAGLVGRAELLAAAFMGLGLWLHLRPSGSGTGGRGGERPAALVWGTALAFLAASSKESAFAFPLFAWTLHVAAGRSLRKALPAWTGYALGLGLHLILRRQVLGGWLNPPGSTVLAFDNPLVALSGVERFLGGLRVVGWNLGHLVFPWNMAPDYSGAQLPVEGMGLDLPLLGGVVLLAACTSLAFWGLRRSFPASALGAAGAWLLISVLLFMNLFRDLGTVLADRILYWPSVSWALILGGCAHLVLGSAGRSRRRIPVFAGAAGLLAAYALLAGAYLPAWENDRTLFNAAVDHAPRVPRAWFNLARALQDEGTSETVLEHYRTARTLAPDYQEAWAQEAGALMSLKRWEEAGPPLAEALRQNPEDAVSRLNQGVLWLHRQELEKAAERFRELTGIEAVQAEAYQNLALAETGRGRSEAAEIAWRNYLEREPEDPEALNNLAWLLITRLDRSGEGEALVRKAVGANPENPNFYDTLAEALFRQGKIDAAIEAARAAVRLENSESYRRRLERLEALR